MAVSDAHETSDSVDLAATVVSPEFAEVQRLLGGDQRAELLMLRRRVEELEALMMGEDGRANAVGEVLVDSVGGIQATALGAALTPSVEEAVNLSARSDSTVLAEALYPVMGPAIRKMIAAMFTPNSAASGSFRVQQLLLIERESGVLLAASAADEEDLEDSDVVSGMLDAIRLFVQEAFDTPEHDGLQDLRVGDTSVLVEWGPNAVLASVVRGVPTNDYRRAAAITLEELHRDYGSELENFNGRVDAFDATRPRLRQLYKAGTKRSAAEKTQLGLRYLGFVVILVVLGLLIWWLVQR